MAIDRTKLANEIRVGIKDDKDNTLQIRTKRFAEEVQAYWKDVAWPESAEEHVPHGHPYETGSYRESIKIERKRKRFGLPRYAVQSQHPNANFIEFGTGVDKPGGHATWIGLDGERHWGPNTPTPQYAPAGRTAHHFGGTMD